jgi:hypothetical protein
MRRGPLSGTVSILCCFNHLSSASLTTLRSGLRNGCILDTLRANALIILVLVFLFQNVSIVELTRPNSQQTPAFFFFFNLSCHFIVISEVDALIHVVLSKVEKHVPYGELVGTIADVGITEFNCTNSFSSPPPLLNDRAPSKRTYCNSLKPDVLITYLSQQCVSFRQFGAFTDIL